MKMLLILVMCVSSFAMVRPAKIVADFEESIDKGLLGERTVDALDNLMRFTVKNLSDKGFMDDAFTIERQWGVIYKFRTQNLFYGRAIPDHDPLFDWLDNVMNIVIEKIGRPACVATHICDLYSFNKTIKIAVNVITKKCDFDMSLVPNTDRKDEHRRCMATDGVFSGLYSVVVYWITEGACLAAGGNMLCGVLATVAQGICEKYVCGPLADRIYSGRCENGERTSMY